MSRKHERLQQLESLILSIPGLNKSELARRLDIDRSTVGRYIDELSLTCPLSIDVQGGVSINDGSFFENIRFSTTEAVTLYLACSLMSKQIDRRNPFAAALIRKLSSSLEVYSEDVASQMRRHAQHLEDSTVLEDREFILNMEGLSSSWLKKVCVRFDYLSMKGEIHHYCGVVGSLVPNVAGQTFMAVIQLEKSEEVRMFRVDRVRNVKVTSMVQCFSKLEEWEYKLSHAWGVFTSDKKPQRVTIRFSPRVSRRVQETQWHPSREISYNSDGFLNVSFTVAEPREMFPWIRGWGADAEILEPAWLREEMVRESEKLANIYKNPSSVAGFATEED